MKEIKDLKGVHVYDMTDEADKTKFAESKLSRIANGRLRSSGKYQIMGFCHVDESTNRSGEKIQAWDGILLKDLETGRQFPAGVNTMTGTGFQLQSDNTWKVVTVSNQLFQDALSCKKNTKFEVTGVESLEVTPFGGEAGEYVSKDFYLLKKIINLKS